MPTQKITPVMSGRFRVDEVNLTKSRVANFLIKAPSSRKQGKMTTAQAAKERRQQQLVGRKSFAYSFHPICLLQVRAIRRFHDNLSRKAALHAI